MLFKRCQPRLKVLGANRLERWGDSYFAYDSRLPLPAARVLLNLTAETLRGVRYNSTAAPVCTCPWRRRRPSVRQAVPARGDTSAFNFITTVRFWTAGGCFPLNKEFETGLKIECAFFLTFANTFRLVTSVFSFLFFFRESGSRGVDFKVNVGYFHVPATTSCPRHPVSLKQYGTSRPLFDVSTGNSSPHPLCVYGTHHVLSEFLHFIPLQLHLKYT